MTENKARSLLDKVDDNYVGDETTLILRAQVEATLIMVDAIERLGNVLNELLISYQAQEHC